MAYIAVENFNFGMDRRRQRVAGTPGTLWLGKEVHITRGGDIERRKKFVPEYDLGEGTFGVATLRGQLYVFGEADQGNLDIPIGVLYQRLAPANSSETMTRVLDVKAFDGKLYVVARFTDGLIHHFYDEQRITDWDTIADQVATVELMASVFADDIDVDEDVTAVAFGNVIALTAREENTSFTLDVLATQGGDISDETITAAMVTPAGVGVKQVSTVTFGGTFEPEDRFTITINGNAYVMTGRTAGTGRNVFIDKGRVWSPVGSLWRFSMLDRADIWDPENSEPDNDAGFLNVASDTEGNESLVVGARYQTLSAVFSRSSVALYQTDVDPAQIALSDSLENTGTGSAGSVVRYGNNDTFYLDPTGIRSLRARDASNAPFVSDVGNAIDTFVQEYIETLNNDQIRTAIATIEPKDGRYMLFLGSRVFVLSAFPGAKISAWTYYEPDEFEGEPVSGIAKAGTRLYVRSGNFIYVYGGLDGDELPDDDEVTAVVHLPFLAAKTPATIKEFTGYDMAATNEWTVRVAFDPNNEGKSINVGSVSEITLNHREKIPMNGEAAVFAPQLTCSAGGAATISMLAVHYTPEDDAG